MKSIIIFTCVIAATFIDPEIYPQGAVKANAVRSIEDKDGDIVTNEYTHYHNQTRFDMTAKKTAECNGIFGAKFSLAATNFGDWVLYAPAMDDTKFELINDFFYNCVDPDTSLPIVMENRALGALGDADGDYLENTHGPDTITLIREPMMRAKLSTSQFSKRLIPQVFSFFAQTNLKGNSVWNGPGQATCVTISATGFAKSYLMVNKGTSQSKSELWPHHNCLKGDSKIIRVGANSNTRGNRNTYSFKQET